jgi:uncharacterized protein (TIGR02678 family)
MSQRLHVLPDRTLFVSLVDQVAITRDQDPRLFQRMRARQREVREWFSTYPAWPLVLGKESVRVIKSTSASDPGQGQRWVREIRDYEMMVWILWFIEKHAQPQFLLSQMVNEIQIQANETIAPDHVDWTVYSKRLSLRRAVHALLTMGAISEVDGDLDQFTASRSGDVLFDVGELAQRLHVNLPEEVYRRLVTEGDTTILRERAPETTTPMQRLYRALLLSPALYASDDPAAFALLQSRAHRAEVADNLASTIGWDLEVTRSYAAVLRNTADVAGRTVFPGRDTISQIAVLLSERIRTAVAEGSLIADERERVRVSGGRLAREIASLDELFRPQWSQEVRSMAGESLREAVFSLMGNWGLLDGPDEDGYYHALPLAARYRGEYREGIQNTSDDEGA